MPVTIQPTSLKYKNSNNEFQTVTAIKGDSGVYYGETAPSDPNVNVWIDPNGEAETFVRDVQVNGTSVLNAQSVANVPYASSSTPGVIQIGSGLYTTDGKTGVDYAGTSQIKAGTANAAMPVSRQHTSIYYGLAKLAGADMKNLSGETVGVYPEAQKIAIQKMLGIYEAPWELLNDITLTEESSIDLTADDNGTPYSLRGVYVQVYYAANLTAASSGYGRFRFVDENDLFLHTETGKYSATANDAYKSVLVQRIGGLAIANFTRQAVTNGSGGTWLYKVDSGIKFNFSNIVRIFTYNGDPEPAGTRIQIYGQRAY